MAKITINRKKIAIFSLLVVALLIVPGHFSLAGAIGTFAQNIISGFAWVIAMCLYFIGYVFFNIVLLAGIFFNWVLELNSQLIQNPVVSIGWGKVRDVANLGFVLLIIVIAFSTILKLGNFQMKQALPKLIIAALLINFSLIFAGIVLDGAGIFMNYFLNNAYDSKSTSGGISYELATSMSIYKGLQPPDASSNLNLGEFGAGILTYMANIVFLDIMNLVAAITLFALGFMFLLRYINIGILLILLPIAVMAWAIGSKFWSTWVQKFLNYTFFGPIASFFVYIALVTTTAFQSTASSYIDAKVAGSTVLQGTASSIASMIMLVSILILGLKYSEEMAGVCAVGGYKVATGAINGFIRGGASTAFSLAGGKQLSNWASKVGKNSNNSFVRGITRPLRQTGTSASAGLKKYGGITGIVTGTMEGIGEGMGSKARAFRLKEEKGFEDKQKKEKNKQAKIENIMRSQEKQRELSRLSAALEKQQEDLRLLRRSIVPDDAKIKAKEDEIKKTEGQIRTANEEKVKLDVDIKENDDETIEKVLKEVTELKEKGSSEKKEEKK